MKTKTSIRITQNASFFIPFASIFLCLSSVRCLWFRGSFLFWISTFYVNEYFHIVFACTAYPSLCYGCFIQCNFALVSLLFSIFFTLKKKQTIEDKAAVIVFIFVVFFSLPFSISLCVQVYFA